LVDSFSIERTKNGVERRTYGDNGGAPIRFVPDFPVPRTMQPSSVRIDVTSDFEEEITEEGKCALITTLGGKNQVLVVVLNDQSELTTIMNLSRSLTYVHPINTERLPETGKKTDA
jgi:hypothetical protein